MRSGLFAVVVSCALALVLMLPGTSVAVGTPGDVNGSLTNDPYWSADPGWCCVMEQNDVDETNWWTGMTFYDVSYRANLGDSWDSYINEITLPWIGIQMDGGSMIRYEYSQVTSAYHIYFDGSSYSYHTYIDENGQRYTGLYIHYELDFDGDSSIEWKFWEKIEFHPPENPPYTGWFVVEFQITQHPEYYDEDLEDDVWGYNLTKVETIEIPFLFDPDVYDTETNDFYNSSNGGVSWTQVTAESSYTGSDMAAKIVNELPDPDIELIVTPNPCACTPTNQIFTFLHYEGNEYAHAPSDYNDDADLQDQNGLIWYIESYDVQSSPPPNADDGSATGFICEGFVA